MGTAVYTALQSPVGDETPLSASVQHMENRHLRVELNANGHLISMYDKDANREVLEQGTCTNLLTVFEDISHREPVWNIDLKYQNHFGTLGKATSVSLLEANSIHTVVRVVYTFCQSVITQDIVPARDARRVDFVTHVHWQETQRM